MMALWLIICASTGQARVELQVDDLTKAPRISPLPAGLPDPRVAPTEGSWRDTDGKERFVGTFLPAPLDAEVMRRLRLLDRLPDFMQVQIDQLMLLSEQKVKGQVAVTEARCIAERVRAGPQIQEGWSNWQMIGAVLLAAAVGAGVVAIGHAVSP